MNKMPQSTKEKKAHHSKHNKRAPHVKPRRSSTTAQPKRKKLILPHKRKSPSKRKKRAFQRALPTKSLHAQPGITHNYSIVITSYKEKGLQQAIEAILSQKTNQQHEIIVVSPEQEVKNLVATHRKHHHPITFFQDRGKGKSAALNQVLPTTKGTMLILTDGDVILQPHAIEEILKPFRNPQIGCVSGRVISANPKNTMLGFWSHLLADAGAHNIRKKLAIEKKFLECTGYLFAFRNLIKHIPTDVAEDALIPHILKENGIAYAPQAKVLVKNPLTFKDWIKQRKRTAKSHETLKKYVNTKSIPQVKSFSNELRRGWLWAVTYPKTIKEYYWTLLLFLARLYMWITVHYETKVEKKHYQDNWEKIYSTR